MAAHEDLVKEDCRVCLFRLRHLARQIEQPIERRRGGISNIDRPAAHR